MVYRNPAEIYFVRLGKSSPIFSEMLKNLLFVTKEKIAPTHGFLAVRAAGAERVRDCLESTEKQEKNSSAARRKKHAQP
ncbi:MAG TPA: hypothetical protein DCE08_07880 [Ruminococcaceae bacterium]|nr:hypothetical protein [Oscillospiraceae bacterium]